MVIAMVVQAQVGINRLNKYLNSGEIDPNAVGHDGDKAFPVQVKDGTFSWTDEAVTLKDINFSVKAGSLTAVGMFS
jgi:ATP-binding cassette subfamily C (CFTR/MRP) protein 1